MLRMLFVVLLGIIVSGGCCQAFELQDFPQDHSDPVLKPDPAVAFARLDNGLRYCVMRNEQPKEKVSIRLQVQNGSMVEDDNQRGLAHYLEHMAFDGTAHFPPGKLVELLQGMGLAFGAHTNAHTSFDETVYKLDMADSRPETIATGLKVMADWAGAMLLLPEQADKERGVILAEMRDRNDPDFREFVAASKGLYPGTRISQRMPIGVAETVKAATAGLMRSYYDDWYRPEMMVLAVVGDLDTKAVAKQIQTAFSGVVSRSKRERPDFGTVVTGLEYLYVHEPEDSSTTAQITLVRPRTRPHDTMALRIEELMQDIGNKIFDRRLSDLVEKNPTGPLLSGGSMSGSQWMQIWEASVSIQARPGHATEALRDVEIERQRMLRFGPTASELSVTIDGIRSSLDQAVAEVKDRTNVQLATALYTSVYFDTVFLSPEQHRDFYLPLLKQVTADAVTKALAVEWSDQGAHTLVSVIGRDDLGPEADNAIRGAFDVADASHIEPPVVHANATWAYGEVKDSGTVLTDSTAEPQICKLGFANHVLVNLKHSDFQPGQVRIAARLVIPAVERQVGVSDLVSMAFLGGGLGKHTAQDLREIFAPTSVQVSSLGFDDDQAVFQVGCLPKDLEFALQALRAYIIDPGWRDEAASRAKTEWLEALRALPTNLDAQVSRAFQFAEVSNAPQRRPVTLDEATAVTLAQAQSWFSPILATAPMEVTIVGDIDLGQTAALAKHYLGSLGERKPMPVLTLPPPAGALAYAPPMPAKSITLDVPGTNPRALVFISWPTEDYYDVVRTRRLGVLASAMSEKLRVKVRNELGQAYSPYAFRTASEAYQGAGFIAAMVGVAPEKVDSARAAVLAIADDLATHGIDDELMGRVMAPIIKNIPAQRQRNDYWLTAVLLRLQAQPFRLEWSMSMEKDYASITKEEINALAKQYLVNAKSLQVVGVCKGASAPADTGAAKTTPTPSPAPTPAPTSNTPPPATVPPAAQPAAPAPVPAPAPATPAK